jgi:hypothetical protein
MSTLPTIAGGIIPALPVGETSEGQLLFQHPEYQYWREEWRKMRDCYAGQRAVKERAMVYFPATAGMQLDGMGVGQPGLLAYEAYLRRAKFHDFVEQGVNTYTGLLEQKPAKFVLPAVLQPLLEKATKDGETLENLFRRIHTTQLLMGRMGLLFDIDTSDPNNPVPFIATYEAEAIINWDAGNAIEGVNRLSMVLLDESSIKRDGKFEWKLNYRYRALTIGDGESQPQENDPYTVSIYDDQDYPTTPTEPLITPNYRGKPLTQIPFVFVNSTHTLADIEKPPLLGLADLSLTLYRTEGDYRQALYMQGQDTLVVVGGTQSADDTLRTGAGARIDVQQGGDAKYIGVDSSGLSELRQAVQNDVSDANARSGQMLAQTRANAESGQALGTRLSAQTATLNTIALSSAASLQALLRMAAVWMGQPEESVVITPNLEFSDFTIPGQEIQALVVSKPKGLPISLKSMHQVLIDKGLTHMTWEEEQAELDKDAGYMKQWGLLPLNQPTGGGAGGTNTGTMPNAAPANPNANGGA